jgi:hypothetical protein
MNCTDMSRADAIAKLIEFVNKGAERGAYRIEEAKMLNDAMLFFDKSVEAKPQLVKDGENQEQAALELLVQACRLANDRKTGAYTIPECAAIFDLVVHLRTQDEAEKAEIQKKRKAKRSKVEEKSDSE